MSDFIEEKPENMDAELRLIARFHALTLWRITMSLLLAAFDFMCVFFGLRMLSGFYIFFVINLLPWLLEEIFSPYIKKTAPVLPYLRKRYHYSTPRHITMQVTLFATCMLLLLWQFHNSVPLYPAAFLYRFPIMLAALSVFFRFIMPVFLTWHMRRRMGVR